MQKDKEIYGKLNKKFSFLFRSDKEYTTIGTFIFYVVKLRESNSQNYRDYTISYRLKLWNTAYIESSTLEHRFYFVGYTDIIYRYHIKILIPIQRTIPVP